MMSRPRAIAGLVLAVAVAATTIAVMAGAPPTRRQAQNPYAELYEKSIRGMAAPDQTLDGVMAASAPIIASVMAATTPQSKTCSQRCSTTCSKTCTTTRGCSSNCKVQTDGCGGVVRPATPPAEPVGQPSSGVLSSVATAPPGYFTLGSTEAHVRSLQGTPSSVIGDTWSYEYSSITFRNGVVSGYSNISKNLRVSLRPMVLSAATPVSFGIGSTQDEVLAVQGTPTSVIGSTWSYEYSSITFRNGVVAGYSNISKNLKAR